MKRLLATLIFLGLLAPSFASAALTTNLQGYWKFDESSGNAASQVNSNTLTNTGTATFGAGILGNATTLASTSNQYFAITNASQTGLSFTTAFTFNFWVQVTNQPGSGHAHLFISKDDAGTNQRAYAFEYRNAAGTIELTLFIAGDCAISTFDFLNAVTTITPNTWTMITASWDGPTKTATFYKNGTSLGTAVGTVTAMPVCTSPVELGGDHLSLPGDSLNGKLDEFGAWSRVLTGPEVTSLYNTGTGLSYPFSVAVTTVPFFWNWDF